MIIGFAIGLVGVYFDISGLGVAIFGEKFGEISVTRAIKEKELAKRDFGEAGFFVA